MYLSRAELMRGPGALSAWASALKDSACFDRGHKLIWTLFSRGEASKRTFLWREIEAGSYITLSQDEPRDETKLWRISTKEFAPELLGGDMIAFSLRANPAVAVKVEGQRGKRADAIMHAKRPAMEREAKRLQTLDREGQAKAALDWLYKREARLGVVFDRNKCATTSYDVIRAGESANGGRISFAAVDYEGVLEVREPSAFLAALSAGVGKAKAYGCGLMLIRRA
jgi:CRISPR system Cascade subunit CasE